MYWHGQGMDERAVATVLGEVLAGVTYLHGRNIVHRDIKVRRHAGNLFSMKRPGAANLIPLYSQRRFTYGLSLPDGS